MQRASMLKSVLLSGSMAVAAAAFAEEAPLVVGTLGDSMSTGFNSRRVGDNRDLSWGSGTGVNSIAKRLGAQTGRPIVARNKAIAGSVAADIGRQVTRLLAEGPVDLVTLTVGANDICQWHGGDAYPGQLAQYEQDLRTNLDRLIAANPDTKILLAPIPSLANLWYVSKDQPGCQQRWDLTGFCRQLLSRDTTDEERIAFHERWTDANRTIEAVAAAYPANARFDVALSTAEFRWEHVSPIDCFHPSALGQELLAEKTWTALATGL